jgi:ATP-dependent protease HslVU (ClpYQ) ATPase subunit
MKHLFAPIVGNILLAICMISGILYSDHYISFTTLIVIYIVAIALCIAAMIACIPIIRKQMAFERELEEIQQKNFERMLKDAQNGIPLSKFTYHDS